MTDTDSRSSARAAPRSPGARWWSGPMALPRWVTSRAPASAASPATSAVHAEWPSDTRTPRRSGGDGVERAGQLGGEGEHPDHGSPGRRATPASTSGRDELGTMGAGHGQERPLEVGAGDLGSAPRRAGGGLRPSRPARPRARRSGAVTMVGHHVVTPWASRRLVERAPSRLRSAPATSTAPMPLTWRSTKPGASTTSGTGPAAGLTSTTTPSSTTTSASRTGPRA